MSEIPQRKKSPEELAALRQREFPTPPPQQPAAPSTAALPTTQPETEHIPVVGQEFRRHVPPEKHGVFHLDHGLRPDAAFQQPQGHEGVHAHIPATHQPEPKKSYPLRHGTPHHFDGLRPQDAAAIPVHNPPPSLSHTTLPDHKHSEQEILQMRRRDLLQTRPPVARIRNMALHPVFASIIHLLALTVPWLTYRYWNELPPKNWLAPGIGGGILLVLSLLIYITKKRARHHAAFLCAIALITIGFCILFTLKHPYAP